ncbi:MAG: ribonucleotide-diphosphate reductase subunit beta [Nitrososphaerales archaeon]
MSLDEGSISWDRLQSLVEELSLYDVCRLSYLVREKKSLIPKSQRLGLYPIEQVEEFQMAKMLLASHWSADEVRLDKDIGDYAELTEEEKRPLEFAFGFFAVGDGTVSEIILDFLLQTASSAEERLFYTYQLTNEAVHNETYGLMIETLVRDVERKKEIFAAVENIKSIEAINDFSHQILKKRGGKKQLYFIQMIMEYLIFTPLFCIIYWYKAHKKGLMWSIIKLNELVARDEGLHAMFAALKYRKLPKEEKYSRDEIITILEEAVVVIDRFIEDIFDNIRLPELTTENVKEYVRFVADDLLTCINEPKYYFAKNPFIWMEYHKYIVKQNFYEGTVTEYAKFDPAQSVHRAMQLSGLSNDSPVEGTQTNEEAWF